MFACYHHINTHMDASMEACVWLLVHASSMGAFPHFDGDSGKERNRCGGGEVQSATKGGSCSWRNQQ